MNFPGHRYLGPGNSVYNGEPVDEDDRIAYRHDWAYERAESEADIRAADRAAISDFSKDFVATGNWHSALGSAGLSIKYGIESLTGVLYPNMAAATTSGNQLGGMDQARDMGEGEPASKRAKVDNTAEHKMGGTASQTSNTVNMAGGTDFQTGKYVFHHSRLYYSVGYQYHVFTAVERTTNSGQQFLVTTPLARVPCHGIPFYLTNTEFSQLPIGSVATKCRVQVSPLGYRTPFTTNSAGISNVNSMLLVHGVYAHGLNNKYNGCNRGIAVSNSSPMIPTNISIDSLDGINENDLWGGTLGTSLSYSDLPQCFGVKKPFRTYYCQNVDFNTGGPIVPDIMDDLNIFTMMNGMGNPIIDWEYRPQKCLLKVSEPYPFFRNIKTDDNTKLLYGSKVPFAQSAQVTFSDGQTSTFSDPEPLNKTTVTIPYASYIEQVGGIMSGLNEYGGGLAPPSLHVGVLPVYSFSTTDPLETDVQDLIAVWKVDSWMEIEYSQKFTYPYGTFVHPVMKVFGDTTPFAYANNSAYSNFGFGYRSYVPPPTTGSTVTTRRQDSGKGTTVTTTQSRVLEPRPVTTTKKPHIRHDSSKHKWLRPTTSTTTPRQPHDELKERTVDEKNLISWSYLLRVFSDIDREVVTWLYLNAQALVLAQIDSNIDDVTARSNLFRYFMSTADDKLYQEPKKHIYKDDKHLYKWNY